MLCWHVDYWDYLGWKDPYAAKEFTARQKRYKALRKPKSFGTPQFVVDGEFLPWEKGAYDRIPGLAAKGHEAAAPYRITATAKVEKKGVRIRVRLEPVDAEFTPAKSVSIVPVLYLKRAKTECDAGENKGKTLTEYLVAVEQLAPVRLRDALEPDGAEAKFRLPDGERADNLGVALLIENAATLRTLDSVTIPVSARER